MDGIVTSVISIDNGGKKVSGHPYLAKTSLATIKNSIYSSTFLQNPKKIINLQGGEQLTMNNKIFSTFLVTALALGMTSMAAAQVTDEGGADVTENAVEGPFSGSSPSSYDTTAGEIANVSLNATRSTDQWSAVYGNATGEIILADDSSPENRLYDWDASASHVFASQSGTLDTSSFTAGDTTKLGNEFTFLSGSQDAATTFSSSVDVSSSDLLSGIGGNTVAAETYDASNNPTWTTAYVKDGSSNGVFVGPTQAAGTSFYDGSTASTDGYQMILPENNTNTAAYSLWLELE